MEIYGIWIVLHVLVLFEIFNLATSRKRLFRHTQWAFFQQVCLKIKTGDPTFVFALYKDNILKLEGRLQFTAISFVFVVSKFNEIYGNQSFSTFSFRLKHEIFIPF